jgi:GGDEF domain-containing protein
MATKNTVIRHILEIFGFYLLVVLIDWFLEPNSWGFPEFYYTPYLILPPLLASFYGTRWGLLTFLVGEILIASSLFWFGPGQNWSAWLPPLQLQQFSGSLSLALAFFLGRMRSALKDQKKSFLERLRRFARSNWGLKQKTRALIMANLELENRVMSQKDSITLLYSQMVQLQGLNLSQALETLLETGHIFSGLRKASIWRFSPSEEAFHLEATFGWPKEEILPEPTLHESIQGWVVQNASLFSLRMLLQYQLFEQLTQNEAILALPIMIDRRVWGVLNVEDLPFERYSLYTERILQLIVKLAEPSLSPIIEHQRLFSESEKDPETGIPLFSQLFRFIQTEITRAEIQGDSFSIILLEIINLNSLVPPPPGSARRKIWKSLAERIKATRENPMSFFHYKEDSQMAIYIPNLGEDAIPLFCLELVTLLNNESVEWNNDVYPVEVVLGYGSFRAGINEPGEILGQAEQLLNMQKV